MSPRTSDVYDCFCHVAPTGLLTERGTGLQGVKTRYARVNRCLIVG